MKKIDTSCSTTLPTYFILGPTGVGKSDFALALAAACNGEIINCDVGQFYVPLTIGTAKPAWKEEKIPHHLYDLLTDPEDYTVMSYHKAVSAMVNEIRQRGKTPLIVGGSLFYAQALFFPPCDNQTASDNFSTSPNLTNFSTKQLWEQLAAIDPQRAQELHPNDRYRLERALTLWATTGVRPSTCKPRYAPIVPNWRICYVTRERAELYERINRRTEQMIRQTGWIEEVKALDPRWYPFVRKKGFIGYGEIIDTLQQGTSEHELINAIQQETRHYAKRQGTFWRAMKRKLEEQIAKGATGEICILNLTLHDVDLYIRQLCAQQYPKINK